MRLKGYFLNCPALRKYGFLFQTGAIKREEITTVERSELLCFYSKLVRLKATQYRPVYYLYLYFYSTLVRLKGENATRIPGITKPFLFQTGAIKRTVCPSLYLEPGYFYSKLVRLKATVAVVMKF